MIAQIGDKMPSILTAAKKAAAQPIPRITRGKGGEERTSLRAPPRRFKPSEEGVIDPRIPANDTILQKKDLRVLVRRVVTSKGVEPRFYVTKSKRIPVGTPFTSLSAVAKAHENGSSVNGFAYFDLQNYPAEPSACVVGKADGYDASRFVEMVAEATDKNGKFDPRDLDVELSWYARSL
jgi:hypothetical protein